MKNKKGIFLCVFVLFICFGMILRAESLKMQKILTYSEVIALFEGEKVVSYNLEKNDLTLILIDESVVSHKLANLDIFSYDLGDLIKKQCSDGIIVEYDYFTEQ